MAESLGGFLSCWTVQTRVSCEVRPGRLEFYSVWSLKPSGTGDAQLLWAGSPTAWLGIVKMFPLTSSQKVFFLMAVVSSLWKKRRTLRNKTIWYIT